MSEVNAKTTKDGLPRLEVKFPLFKNENKEHENQPDYKSWDKDTGIGASAWLRKSKNGVSYMSVVVDFPNDGVGQPSQPVKASMDIPLDDDIPF